MGDNYSFVKLFKKKLLVTKLWKLIDLRFVKTKDENRFAFVRYQSYSSNIQSTLFRKFDLSNSIKSGVLGVP